MPSICDKRGNVREMWAVFLTPPHPLSSPLSPPPPLTSSHLTFPASPTSLPMAPLSSTLPRHGDEDASVPLHILQEPERLLVRRGSDLRERRQPDTDCACQSATVRTDGMEDM